MDSFKLLKRRTTELFNSLPQHLPSIGGHGNSNTMKGTWEKIQVPPLPRSSHSANIVAGTLYIFGGEVTPGRPVDNDMHVVTLPSSGAQADYYAVKAKAAKPSSGATATKEEKKPGAGESEPTLGTVPEEASPGEDKPGPLSEISLTTPSPDPITTAVLPPSPTSPHPSSSSIPDVPPPRTGHATAVIGHRIFLFGGRAPSSSSPLNEGGRIWVFDTRTHLWSFLDPVSAAPATGSAAPAAPVIVPPPRSGHCAVATGKPDDFVSSRKPDHHGHGGQHGHGVADTMRDWALGSQGGAEVQERGIPQRPVVGVLAERARDADAEGYGTVIIHGGRIDSTEGGEEVADVADVWAFDVRSRVWQRLPDAPKGRSCGGGMLALSRSRLYRFGGGGSNSGEDGPEGQLDYLELGVSVFDDQISRGEAVLCARGTWQTLHHGREDVGYKDPDPAAKPLEHVEDWPGNRAAASFEAITVGGGREYLVLMFGEKESTSGTGGDGKFWDDVWTFQVPAQGMSLASVADTAFSVVGRKSGEGRWTRVETAPWDDEDDASAEGPGARGWVASATMGDLEENGIVVWGGVGEGGRRLGDGWIFRLG